MVVTNISYEGLISKSPLFPILRLSVLEFFLESDRLANTDFLVLFSDKACLYDPCENDNSKLVVVVIDVDFGAE